MEQTKVVTLAGVFVGLFACLTSILLASPLPPLSARSVLAHPQCPGGKPPPCPTQPQTPRPPPNRKLTPRAPKKIRLDRKAKTSGATSSARLNEAPSTPKDDTNPNDRLAGTLKPKPTTSASENAARGDVLLLQGKYAEAEAPYREAVRLESSNAVYNHNLGLILYYQQKYAEAEFPYREAVRLNPSVAAYHLGVASALFNQQKYAEAEPYYRKAVHLEPKNAAYNHYLGFVLSYERKYAEAESSYREAVRLESSNAVYNNYLGLVLFYQQKYAEAERYQREAVRLSPNVAVYFDNLGTALFSQQKYADAESSYREAVRLESSNASYNNNLGLILYYQQKYAEAEHYHREAVRLDPGNAGYAKNLSIAKRDKNLSGSANQAAAQSSRTNVDFSTPRAAVETYLAAAASGDVDVLSQCFAAGRDEFRGLREKTASQTELDDLAKFVQGAQVVDAREMNDEAVVRVTFRTRHEEIRMKKSDGGWKIWDF